MSDPVFVDTNVFVYSRDTTEPSKQSTAEHWIRELWQHHAGRVSRQVLIEYYAVVTRKLSRPMMREAARADIRALQNWMMAGQDSDRLDGAWQLEDRFGLSWWDAMIVHSALTVGCRYLLSDDFQDGQNFNGVTVVNPFRHAPDRFLT